ncbi:uncharacterized protein LDX57_002151 [Aspergillus melleus]|uniref:uncharacterized protein n=1 Tax=Aspergillus melleus TaxID=138277 RepID=UPI001E8E49C4|nr:uncharacterized protein LDX57_002151 [Aspergillus melleus]KAH8424400.1 hypothetical protein LDX57_002151 [Aspergillus melleus]
MSTYQPYQCLVCQSRFTRHENLKRHAKLHSASHQASLRCGFCQTTFSRPDLRNRHMKRKHPEHESGRAVQRQRRRAREEYSGSSPDSHDGFQPHHSGDEMNLDLLHDHDEPRGISMLQSETIDRMVQDALGTALLKPTYELASPVPCTFDQLIPGSDCSPLQIARGCDLFFSHVSHYVPFLHRPTFDATMLPVHLVLAIICLGYQHGEDPECDDQPGSGASLSTRCFRRAHTLTTADEGGLTGPNTPLIQSYLLLQICAMMYLCGDDSAIGLKMHSDMISLARAGGLMQPTPPESSAAEDLEGLWRDFIKTESHKRTSFAVHQIDALWYQFLSIPRCISHLEVKHDLPCPEDQWTASSAADWAHRQLVARHPGPSVPYPEAVRRFLSSETSSIPTFDPYGAVNVAQFLISSAREASGWSTMTGMLSMDRLDALRSSLIALGPFIRPQPETGKVMHTAATWETAMIELHLWSPAHTGGVVASSLDAVLSQSTALAPSYEFLWDVETAKAIQPHVDWFLRYLDTTLDPSHEAPWAAVYAYKAFLIAWQLVRGGIPGAMEVAGIQDGDEQGALEWARNVFRRREQWQIGKLILSSLQQLES